MKGILLILWVKGRSTINDLRGMNKEKLIRLLFFSAVGILFVVFDYFFFLKVIGHLLSVDMGIELVGDVLLTQLMGMINLTLFSVLIFSNVIASLSTLYISKDLNLLLSTPLKHTRVFIAKYFQTTINSSYMVIIFGLPIYFALGSATGMGMGYYVSIPFLLVPFIIIPAGLGIVITMTLMRFFPAKRTHQIFTFLGMIFAAVLVLLFRFLRPETLYMEVTDMSQPAFVEMLSNMSVPDYPFLPSTWLTHILNDLIGIEDGVLSWNVWILVGVAIGVFFGVVWVARAIYFSGFSQAFESKRRGRNKKKNTILDSSFKSISPPQRAIMIKDIKTFFRDPTQWSQIFLLMALIVIYLFSIYSIPTATPYFKNLTSFLNLGLAGFILSALAVRFVFPLTSLEGEAFWLIFSSPVSVKKYLWGKFFIYLLPLVFLGELLIVTSNFILNADAFFMTLSSISILIISTVITAMGVGFGAIYPRFRYENVAEIAAGFGGIIFMIFSLIYIGLIVIIEAVPVYQYFVMTIGYGSYEPGSLVISLILFIALNLTAFFIPMWIGIRSLRRMEF